MGAIEPGRPSFPTTGRATITLLGYDPLIVKASSAFIEVEGSIFLGRQSRDGGDGAFEFEVVDLISVIEVDSEAVALKTGDQAAVDVIFGHYNQTLDSHSSGTKAGGFVQGVSMIESWNH